MIEGVAVRHVLSDTAATLGGESVTRLSEPPMKRRVR